MSKLTRALALTAMLAAMNLVGMTAAAQAQATDHPTRQDTRRPPIESRVGEYWRDRPAASQEQSTGDATLRRLLARERYSIPNGAQTQVTSPMRPAEPSGRPGWLTPALGAGRGPGAGRWGRRDGRPARQEQPTRRADGLTTSVVPRTGLPPRL